MASYAFEVTYPGAVAQLASVAFHVPEGPEVGEVGIAAAFPVAAGVAGPVPLGDVGVVQAGGLAVRVIRWLPVRLRPVPLAEILWLFAVQAECLVEVITMMSLCA